MLSTLRLRVAVEPSHFWLCPSHDLHAKRAINSVTLRSLNRDCLTTLTVRRFCMPGIACCYKQRRIRATAHVGEKAWSADMGSTSPNVLDKNQNPDKPAKVRMALRFLCGGLLSLMLIAGADAFSRLRQLHAIDDEVRNRLLSRSQALSAIVISVHIYDDQLTQLLPGQEPIGSEIAAKAADANSSVRHYPGDCGPQQQRLLEEIAQELNYEENDSALLLSLTPHERQVRAPQFIHDELIPRSLSILRAAQQIATLNTEDFARDNLDLLAKFEKLQANLKNMLLLGLMGGLLLSVTGSLYILRLERKGRENYRALAASRFKLETLSARLVSAQEQERRSIARELHDEIGQTLQALLVDLGRLSRLLPSGESEAHQQIKQVTWLAETAVKTVRNIALLLRPSMLDDLGLIPALEWQAREISRRGEMEVDVHSDKVPEKLPDETKICVYRIVQEALNNSAAHSSASSAQVVVEGSADKLRVEITDNGQGFDAERVRGMGLLGMEERVRHIGGTFRIVSRDEQGTSVIAELPLTG